MYTPSQFKQRDVDELIKTVQEIKFGALIIFANNQFYTTHIPFIIKKFEDQIILEGHVAIKNEIWKMANNENKTMVIFQGPNAYIHPGWYPSKDQTGKVVPTWNYQVVHCYGIATHEKSKEWILKHVTELTEDNEKERVKPWKVSDAPTEFINQLIDNIIGIKIKVSSIEGALKMNQHHPKENRLGVINGLSESKEPNEINVANIMRKLERDRENER